MEKNDRLFSLRSMVFMAVFAAIICIAAPISIPMPGLVPITLATFAVYLTGAILGAKRGMIAVAIYILIGVAGLPVFSGFAGGFAKLLGPTGGYLIGYIPLVLITGIFADMKSRGHWTMVIGMILGTAAMYTLATVWYMISTGTALIPALLSCVVPFLIGDSIKVICVTAVSMPLKSRLNGIMLDK